MRRSQHRRSQFLGLRRFGDHWMGRHHRSPDNEVIVGRQEDWSRSRLQDRARTLNIFWFGQDRFHDHDIEFFPGQCFAKMRQWGDRHLTWQSLVKQPLHLHGDQVLVLCNENTERRRAHEISFCQGRFMRLHLISVI